MNSIATDHVEGVAAKRLFVLQTAAPSHPLSAPDPHLTLKLRDAELLHRADVEEEEEESEDAEP